MSKHFNDKYHTEIRPKLSLLNALEDIIIILEFPLVQPNIVVSTTDTTKNWTPSCTTAQKSWIYAAYYTGFLGLTAWLVLNLLNKLHVDLNILAKFDNKTQTEDESGDGKKICSAATDDTTEENTEQPQLYTE